MRVLVACEESQIVCSAFRSLGHECFSCDIKPCSGGHPEWHLHQDVIPLLYQDWDLIIAHPPCTYLSKAGARWMFPTSGCLSFNRLRLAFAAREFFMLFYNNKNKYICIENPTPLKVVNLPSPSQIIQPFQFGHPYSKRTLLWLKNLPPLVPTCLIEDYHPYLPSNTSAYYKGLGSGSKGVAHNPVVASRTFPGIASAMALQWSNYILSH